MRLQKYLSAAAATIAIFAVTTSAAHAASTTADINVSASLTAFCENTTSAGNPVVSFTYQSFDAAINNQAADKPLTWRCTRGLTAPTMILDGGTTVDSGIHTLP